MQSALYSERHALKAGLSLTRLGLTSWDPDEVKRLQAAIKVEADGWFGPKSIHVWKAMYAVPSKSAEKERGVVIGRRLYEAPCEVVSHRSMDGVPTDESNTSHRTKKVTQFILHRGVQRKGLQDANYAVTTERILSGRGLSTTFSMDVDGVIYQHFDPKERYGHHCKYHNTRSDSLDVCGPFDRSVDPIPNQQGLVLEAAIGKVGDTTPPHKRAYGKVRCWTMTPQQIDALRVFLPWYCNLRGIPLRACKDWRTFRVGGLKSKDPITKVKGILAHAQVSPPGKRVDGLVPLYHLSTKETDISWVDKLP